MIGKLPQAWCIFVAVSILGGVIHSKDWRGVVPLQSTRAHVERLLGSPPPPPTDGTRAYILHPARSIYFLEEAEVYFVYATADNLALNECSKTVPLDTVLMIMVSPRKKSLIGSWETNLDLFRTFDPSEGSAKGYEGFLNEEVGLVIRTFEGRVDQLVYLPTIGEMRKCSSYYEDPEKFVMILTESF